MVLGPVFVREVVTAPRRGRFYALRAGYTAALGLVGATAWLVLTGTQVVGDVGDFARFGTLVFQILAVLQMALATFFAAIQAASAVAQEKDRRTLLLLLLTRLSNAELVLGKLSASLLGVFMLLAAALPLFMLVLLFGGVALAEVLRVFLVTLASALVAGSLGSTLALWREKTFQALALTALVLVTWVFAWEIVATGIVGQEWFAAPSEALATAASPWRAILAATVPADELLSGAAWTVDPVNVFVILSCLAAVMLNAVALWRLRVWYPSREIQARGQREQREPIEPLVAAADRQTPPAAAAEHPDRVAPSPATATSRRVWSNPILWREMRTWAYGRKMLAIRLGYLALFALAAASTYATIYGQAGPTRAALATSLVPLFLLSLVLVNAQAVTAMTTERDLGALDLLLVTDLTPRELIFGKLGGVLYNTKEMVLLPMLACAYLYYERILSFENLMYLWGGLLVMYVFVAVLGLHAGMSYASSRRAIGVSLGTVFFLFVGVATCMRVMIAFSGAFEVQLQPFLALTLGGGVGLYFALGAQNPSPAIGVAALVCPLATFYAITSFLLDYTLAVFLVVAAAYGFTTLAMLIPALHEFAIVKTQRRTAEE